MRLSRIPDSSFDYTSRANLVGVITNGTAVLGLGNIGGLASKPVMEGKAVLFKKFAGIDSFDIEINEQDPDKFIEIVASLEPTFGGINLEDIKAPECFKIEQTLRDRMKIPVFHDDQHGTAIIVGAAVLNAMIVQKKEIAEVKIVTSGAGAAALSCVNTLIGLGVKPENIIMTDKEGVIYVGRPNLDPTLAHVARQTDARRVAGSAGRGGYFPRPLRAARAEAGMAGTVRAKSVDPGARQSRAGNPCPNW